MTKTTDITTKQIEALRNEARVAGDAAMTLICGKALRGDRECLEECQRVLDDAAAQDDTDGDD